MLLYIKASPASSSTAHIESFAFVPQLALVLVILPWKLAKNDLASCMLAQTFAFVAFNKVCTSQVCPPDYDIGSSLTDKVFSMVYDLLAILPVSVFDDEVPKTRSLHVGSMDTWSGKTFLVALRSMHIYDRDRLPGSSKAMCWNSSARALSSRECL
jgi:hypothetical protein